MPLGQNHSLDRRGTPRKRDGRRGQAMIEFALCFLLFMAMMFGFFQIAMTVWMKTTLHFAVREGIRFAITGRTLTGMDHDDSIKEVIRSRSGGLLTSDQAANLITINYFDPTGTDAGNGPGSNAPGYTVVLAVNNYPVPTLMSNLLTWAGDPISVSAKAVGRQEPYPNAPVR